MPNRMTTTAGETEQALTDQQKHLLSIAARNPYVVVQLRRERSGVDRVNVLHLTEGLLDVVDYDQISGRLRLKITPHGLAIWRNLKSSDALPEPPTDD